MPHLLIDPVFSTDAGLCSLPELLGRLSRGEDVRYPAMQAHHEHLWHAFVVQLACIALHREGSSALHLDAKDWEASLRSLAKHESTFALEEADLSLPAFLQPPAPDGAAAYSATVTTPDEFDVLVASKNHDLKRMRVTRPREEHWVYALVAVQTSAGIMGAGNYGVARMNGGYASRPLVGFYRDLSWGSRFVEDVERIVPAIEEALVGQFDPDGAALLWELPWDGKTSLSLDDLHPLFIEVCRRIRRIDGEFQRGTTKGLRVNAKDSKGNVGDPWIPIRGTGEALNVSGRGFTYPLMAEILRKKLRLPAPMRYRAGAHTKLVGEVLACEQGGTAGYHRRVVELPGTYADSQVDEAGADRFSHRAERQVVLADELRKRVLLPALLALLDENPKHDDGFRRYLARYTRAVDDAFFPCLWEGLGLEDEADAEYHWTSKLREVADAVLTYAEAEAPRSSSRPYARRAKARAIFGGAFHNHFASAEEAS